MVVPHLCRAQHVPSKQCISRATHCVLRSVAVVGTETLRIPQVPGSSIETVADIKLLKT